MSDKNNKDNEKIVIDDTEVSIEYLQDLYEEDKED
jgi:hypothetical protein